MMSSTARTTSVRLDSVVDDAVLAYAEWRQASAAVWDAYGRWESTAGPDHACAHAAYLAAVDQEQAAADAYEDLIGPSPRRRPMTEPLNKESARG